VINNRTTLHVTRNALQHQQPLKTV